MGLRIEDGTGNSYEVKVNDQNMLSVNSVVHGINYFMNKKGHFYTCPIEVTPAGPGDCFFYLKNLGDPDLIVQRLSAHVPTNEVIKGYLNDSGVPVNGANFVPVNRNGGSANLCDCIVEYGADITGLSGGNHFDSFHIAADNHTHTYRWDAGVMIPKNRTFTLYAKTGGIAIDFTVTFFCCAGL